MSEVIRSTAPRKQKAGEALLKGVLMKLPVRTLMLITAVLACFVPVSMSAAIPNSPRQKLVADAGWKFFLGDPRRAEMPSFADATWRAVDLPHDSSIESKPDKDNPSGAGGGFFPRWHRMVSQDVPRSRRLERQACER
jgi:hypothetical protein